MQWRVQDSVNGKAVQSRIAETRFAETLTLTLTLTLNPNFGESDFGEFRFRRIAKTPTLTLISANLVSANREDTGKAFPSLFQLTYRIGDPRLHPSAMP